MKWKIKRIGIDLTLIVATALLIIVINNRAQTVAGDIVEEAPIYCVDSSEKQVSLTFDVNWAEKDYLECILDVMDKYNVKGTFFIMGGWVNYSEDNVNKLKEISKRGHEIGNHSYIHPSFTKITEDKMKEELKKTDDIIEKYTGEKPNIFRFPSGDYNKNAFLKVRNLGYMTIQWNVDSLDWKQLGAKIEYDRVMKGVKPGSIILFHNNGKYTTENLDKIIKELQNQGYTFKTVSKMIYFKDYNVDKEGVQHKNN